MNSESNREESLLGKRKKIVGDIEGSKLFKQLGILVLDGSGSMKERTARQITKGEEVSVGVRNLFSRFKDSKQSNNFCFAVIYYDGKAKLVLDVTETKDVDDTFDYNPLNGMGGETSIAEGLKIAKRIAEKFLLQNKPGGLKHSVVTLIMTDGVDMTPAETRSMANALKSMDGVDVAACFFETLGAEAQAMKECMNFLKELISDPLLFSSVSNEEELRLFFIRSMSNIAGARII